MHIFFQTENPFRVRVLGTKVRQRDASSRVGCIFPANDPLHGDRPLRAGLGVKRGHRVVEGGRYFEHWSRLHVLLFHRRNESGPHHGRLSGSVQILRD